MTQEEEEAQAAEANAAREAAEVALAKEELERKTNEVQKCSSSFPCCVAV